MARNSVGQMQSSLTSLIVAVVKRNSVEYT